MRRPLRTVAAAVAALVVAGALLPRLGTEFLPPLDEGAIAINVVRLSNASLQGTTQVAGYLEQRLMAFPEVTTVVTKSGRAEISEDPMGPEQSDVFVMLKPQSEWGTGRSKAKLVEAMQADLSQIPGLRFSFSQPIALRVNELISGVKSDLAVKVFGDDLELLTGIANQAAVAIANATMHRRLLQQQKLERDMQLAQQVQHSFLPESTPDVQGMKFRVSYRTALHVGGDFYGVP